MSWMRPLFCGKHFFCPKFYSSDYSSRLAVGAVFAVEATPPTKPEQGEHHLSF